MRDFQAGVAAVMRVGATRGVDTATTHLAADARTVAVPESLRILHIMRAPVGGLFRHVVDVARGQAARGHRVGLIVDSLTGTPRADAILAGLAPSLALGLERLPIAREIGPSDVRAWRAVAQRISLTAPDVVHGHGAKAAALSRLVPRPTDAIRVYTPHGGTLVYHPGTLKGRFYRSLEWVLRWPTDLFLFESAFAADRFRTEIGSPGAMVRVVRNGVGDDEFTPIAPQSDATDIVYVGELRDLKGVDLLIEAVAALKRSGRKVSATIAGEGPDAKAFKAQAEHAGVTDSLRFVGHRTAREAFALGRLLVIPSRAESLPYIVLEAVAAGMPMLATRVGGIPEIFGSQSDHLVAPDSATALTTAIRAALDEPQNVARVVEAVRLRVRSDFSTSAMVDGGLAAYREAITMKKLARFA